MVPSWPVSSAMAAAAALAWYFALQAAFANLSSGMCEVACRHVCQGYYFIVTKKYR
jgi:hypothetical protein